MIALGLLPKILYKPKKAYESLKGAVDWKDGIVVYLLCSIISLIIFGGIAKQLNVYVMVVPFGFGIMLTVNEIVMGFIKGVGILLIITVLGSLIATKLGGTGTFSETFGMLGYTRIIGVVQSVISITLLIWIYFRLLLILSAATKNIVKSPAFLGPLGIFILVVSIIFIGWNVILQSVAISVAHDISLIRGFVAVLICFFIVNGLFYGLGVLTGYTILPF